MKKKKTPENRPTDKNLCRFGTNHLMKWLIEAAREKRTVTYGEVAGRLERECGFTSMGRSGARRIGQRVAEPMQKKIHQQKSDAPLLNVLVVRKVDRLPGQGECIRKIFCRHFSDETWLKNERALEEYPEKWKRIVGKATEEVYAYKDWESLYEKIYREEVK